MLPLLIGELPPQPTLVEIINPPQQEIKIEPKQITWQDNPNNCDQETQWIAAESPFYCIPKKYATWTKKASTQPQNGSKPPSGWFPYGQCTYLVWSQRSVGFWNDASDWYWQAQRDGWSTGSTPQVGAIAWQYGHVALVTAVNGDTITIKEMNYKGLGVVSSRTVPASSFKYIY